VRIEVPEKSTISPLEPLKTGLRHQIAPFIATRFTGAVLEEAECALPAVLVLPTGLLDSEAMDTVQSLIIISCGNCKSAFCFFIS
jgi:hypothetical protein